MRNSKPKAFICHFSQIDYDKLLELSEEANMKANEFLRTLVQITYIANKGIDSKGHIEIGGYGITFPPEILEEFSNKLAESFKDFDFESFEKKVKVRPSLRQYRPKEKA
jgi:hypothetical protein